MRELPLQLPEVLLLVAVTVLWPLYESLHGWPHFTRRVSAGTPGARVSAYWEAVLVQWSLVGACIAAWNASGRRWGTPALTAPAGARLWGSVCLLAVFVALQARQLRALRRAPAARAALSRRISAMPFVQLLPTSRRELAWMYPLCVTAGVCEELLYRGFVVWGLAVPLGWWAASAVSLLSFGLMHAYQGKAGILRTAGVGLAMSVVVAVTRSLWPAMALHALLDAGSVTLLYMVLK